MCVSSHFLSTSNYYKTKWKADMTDDNTKNRVMDEGLRWYSLHAKNSFYLIFFKFKIKPYFCRFLCSQLLNSFKKAHSNDFRYCVKNVLKYLPQSRSTLNTWNTSCWQKWLPGNIFNHPGPPTVHQHNQLIPFPLSLLQFLFTFTLKKGPVYNEAAFLQKPIYYKCPWKCNYGQSFKILLTMKTALSTIFLLRKFWQKEC